MAKPKKSVSKVSSASVLERDWLWALGLMLGLLMVYTPVWWAGFVWDDEAVVILNPVIAGPLGLKEIWTTRAADICPLTLTTFWLEYKCWGSAALPYHLVNILMHGACAILLWRVLRALRVPGAWFGAALWALHPVMVESVAWISELKNTESALFFLLAVLFYAKEIRGEGGRWNYSLTLLFAALALASKSSTVVLPVVLGLCAWWMDGRWDWKRTRKLAPIFLMALVAGLATLWTQRGQIDLLVDFDWNRSWAERIVTVGYTVWFYLFKLAWPYPLLTIYPRWEIAGGLVSWLPLVALIAVGVVLWLARKTWGRPWFFALGFFVVAVLPVAGLTNNTYFRLSFVADHFQYLASMGPLVLAGAGLARVVALWPRVAVSSAILVVLGAVSWSQVWNYRDEATLWAHTLEGNPKSWLAENGVGKALADQGRLDDAFEHYQNAIRLKPNYVDGHYNFGVAFSKANRVDEARAQYEAAVRINPRFAKGYRNLGFLLGTSGNVDGAIANFEKSIEFDPNYSEAYYNLGVALYQKGRKEEGIENLRRAVALNPNYGQALGSLGVALWQSGHPEEAVEPFRRAIKLSPGDADLYNNLGVTLALNHQVAEAVPEFENAVRLRSDFGQALLNLGNALAQTGRLPEAVARLEEAVRLNPGDVAVRKALADAKAKMR